MMNLPVTSTLQRLFSRQPGLAMLFQPSGYPMPSPQVPEVLHADFMDTRPVIFRSEGFEEDLQPTHATA
jgi:hypothetical protein